MIDTAKETNLPLRHRGIAIGAGSLAVLLGALDTYVVVSVITDIMRDVGIALNNIQQVTPIVTGYLLGYIAAMPLLGQASDRFGRRRILQLALVGFAIGSVVTAMSTDLTTLVTGRVIQGVASGALLPVTLALGADLWAARNRATVLGGIGAAQELGSVLGPLYGVLCVWLFGSWTAIFWVNVPLAVIAIVLVQFSVPAHEHDANRPKVDIVGGGLLAIALGLLVVGLYSPNPKVSALPEWGLPVLAGSAVAFLAFILWESRAKTRLISPEGVRFGPFFAALAASLAAGAALMVTLVNIELLGQGVLQMDKAEAVFLLSRFLVALPIGAVIGGWLATRFGDRIIAVAGLLIAAFGYYLISGWPVDVLAARHDFWFFTLPRLDTDLVVAGVGLGLVIGPLSSAALRVVPAVQHGIASALVVVARMTGMLIGMAALGGWGIHRFYQNFDALAAQEPKSEGKPNLLVLQQQLLERSVHAYSQMYSEMFAITAIVCLIGAAIAIFVGSQRNSGDEAQ
ncbi:MFS-type drug efflux transporter P55 [Mycobacteroides salmoniphilum]|uniref:MFS-type drug efflux transporter P55 n=1 Tax=Mycobacteroides salmoniphilum TaxID=404941 RepID=A0A4R8S474_9MYCO|nr:MFS transporter [Mycobacteroides salmoniphilum]TDZ78042.1 MFS-type drug efflux transporter P55 [Mycobacteroides salmoniphilum]TDZ82672.1 MFS-type drug efflux transporter P55 [Mycobacteroides salmoniphilum]TDZ85686.1 MFS-type drug efflux transporter P55 [Mycobacteroides salmoniphilum]